jgi:hypothetical protein
VDRNALPTLVSKPSNGPADPFAAGTCSLPGHALHQRGGGVDHGMHDRCPRLREKILFSWPQPSFASVGPRAGMAKTPGGPSM